MDGVRIRDWRWWWGIMGNYWLEVGHMIWSPYQVYPDLWSPQPPPPTYRRHPAHDDAVSGDDTAIDPMTSYMTGAMTDAMTDPLTPKTEPMPDPISESLTDPMRDPRTSLKTPWPIAWLAPSTTPRSRSWLWSWPKVENCDFRAVLSYWSCIQLPYFFFLILISLQPFWAQNGFSLSGLSNGKFPHNVSSQWIFLDTLDEIYPL